MYYGYGMDMSYILMTVITLVLGLGAQAYISKTYSKWSKVPSPSGRTGAEMAHNMLVANKVDNVGIGRIAGSLTDNYNPQTNVLSLSEENFSHSSVASVAVACHEAGHAVQTACGYAPGRIRSAIAPAVAFSQQWWGILFMIGIMMNVMGLVQAALLLFAFSVVFHLVTLPVEIDASRRALGFLSEYGSDLDQRGAREVLTAAAMTYVAAAMSSALQLLYMLSRTRRSRN